MGLQGVLGCVGEMLLLGEDAVGDCKGQQRGIIGNPPMVAAAAHSSTTKACKTCAQAYTHDTPSTLQALHAIKLGQQLVDHTVTYTSVVMPSLRCDAVKLVKKQTAG